jgi:IS605 OrfB family transposase
VKWKQGCFSQDAVQDWWLCLLVEVSPEQAPAPKESVGIDLGIKNAATTSDGERLEAIRFYRHARGRLRSLERRGHHRQAKRLHRKIRRRRLDACHKFSRKIANTYQNIVIGNVSSLKLVKSRLAIAVLDTGWGMLKQMLLYKGKNAGRSVQVVNERNTTRVCSSCGALTGPSGLRQLAVRQWVCVNCGGSHDRDVNAARNILIAGSRWGPPCAETSRAAA